MNLWPVEHFFQHIYHQKLDSPFPMFWLEENLILMINMLKQCSTCVQLCQSFISEMTCYKIHTLAAQEEKGKTWLAVLYFFVICLSICFSFHYLPIFYFNPLNCISLSCIRYFLMRKWERRRNFIIILFKCCEKYKNWLTFLAAATTWSQYGWVTVILHF